MLESTRKNWNIHRTVNNTAREYKKALEYFHRTVNNTAREYKKELEYS